MKIDYKVPGGKLLRIKAEVEEGILKEVKISGDFFLHPEEKITDIEKSVTGQVIEEENLRKRLSEVFKRNDIKSIGFSIDDLIKVLMKLVESDS